MKVNLYLRHALESEGTLMGEGDPERFVASLRHHGWYFAGLSSNDTHEFSTQWTAEGFEVIVEEA